MAQKNVESPKRHLMEQRLNPAKPQLSNGEPQLISVWGQRPLENPPSKNRTNDGLRYRIWWVPSTQRGRGGSCEGPQSIQPAPS